MNKDLKSFLFKVENEGLEYAIQNYYEKGSDPVLDKLVPKTQKLLNEIDSHVNDLLNDNGFHDE